MTQGLGWGAGGQAERTVNMYCRVVTLDVSKLVSGWLDLYASCVWSQVWADIQRSKEDAGRWGLNTRSAPETCAPWL